MADLQSPPPPLSRSATTDLFGDPLDAHPQWFNQSSFLLPHFDSNAYIADLRTFVPFETLRSELHSHLSSLNHELVDLINRDYADFVNLSTKLVDVDAAVVRMRAPMSEIREKILGFRGAVEGSLAALKSGLGQRAEAAKAREVLELLLDTFHVVSKMSSGANRTDPAWKYHHLPDPANTNQFKCIFCGKITNGGVNRTKKYLVGGYRDVKACKRVPPDVKQEIQEFMGNKKSLKKQLQMMVEKLIKELPSVPADWTNGDINPAEKDHLTNGISLQYMENGTNLRETQSMLLERIASEMNRLKFYITQAQNLPFIENMEKRIQNASQLLDASLRHSFVDGLEHRDANAVYNCLRAYAAIDNTRGAEEIFRSTVVAPCIRKVLPHSSSGSVGAASGDELEDDYRQIKHYIQEDCKFVLELSSTENSGLHVFSFLANSILKEVLLAIQKGKPAVFSPGRPTEFLKNYKSSLDFLAHLEGYCPSRSAVAKFRAEAIYIEFLKQWNVGVYFSLRFQEIAGSLDSALTVASLVPIQISHSDKGNSQHLTINQSATLLECLMSCWREDVLVLSCSDKFLRLSLQLISRYSHWVSAGLAARKAGNAGSTPGSEWAISAAPDDFIYIIHDLNCLMEKICGDFLGHVVELLSSSSTEVLDLVKQSILEGGASLKDLIPKVMNSIIQTVVEKSVEDLKQLKGITATYRMTNKPLPVRHSPYVSGVLRPLKTFLDGERATAYLTRDIRDELVQGAALEITVRYYELAADLVSVARKTESSLQRIRQGAQRRAGASSDVSDNNVSDTDKICMQLFLDIQEYGRNLSALGVEAVKIPAFCSLWQVVAPTDRQNTISF